jgi:hypothetical protein
MPQESLLQKKGYSIEACEALSEDEAVFTPSEFVGYIAKARKVEVDAIEVLSEC